MTGRTLESLDFVMHIHVTYIMTPHGEAFLADLARIGHFVQVDTVSVASQTSAGGESGFTHVADKHTTASNRPTCPRAQSRLKFAERVPGRLA